MSEAPTFISGGSIFAVTTVSTLIYGYVTFTQAAHDDGVATVDGISDDRA